MPAPDALGRQFVKMRPSELLPYANERDSDAGSRSKVNDIAESIQKYGYSNRKVDSTPIYNQPAREPHIHLFHSSNGSSTLMNGNHRVAAMTKIGYDRPVKVRVTDRRPGAR